MRFTVALRAGLDGCISQGRTDDEALAEIREAIEPCLADEEEA